VEDAIPPFVDDFWLDNGLEPIPRRGLGHHAYVEICPPGERSDNDGFVALPQGAHQFVNAPCWLRSGAVAVLDPTALDAASVASTVQSGLHSSEMRAAAELAARDIAAMPLPSEPADAVLGLARS
jgi:hypothetical protein